MLPTLILMAIFFGGFSLIALFKDLLVGMILAVPALCSLSILLGYWMGYNQY